MPAPAKKLSSSSVAAKIKASTTSSVSSSASTSSSSLNLNSTTTTTKGSFVSQQLQLISKLFQSYAENTPQQLKLIDVYLAFVMMTGIILGLYLVLAGTYPYNSFLSSFIASVGTFILSGE